MRRAAGRGTNPWHRMRGWWTPRSGKNVYCAGLFPMLFRPLVCPCLGPNPAKRTILSCPLILWFCYSHALLVPFVCACLQVFAGPSCYPLSDQHRKLDVLCPCDGRRGRPRAVNPGGGLSLVACLRRWAAWSDDHSSTPRRRGEYSVEAMLRVENWSATDAR